MERTELLTYDIHGPTPPSRTTTQELPGCQVPRMRTVHDTHGPCGNGQEMDKYGIYLAARITPVIAVAD